MSVLSVLCCVQILRNPRGQPFSGLLMFTFQNICSVSIISQAAKTSFREMSDQDQADDFDADCWLTADRNVWQGKNFDSWAP